MPEKNNSSPSKAYVCIAGIILPGAGYLILGRKVRALITFLIVTSLSLIGFYLLGSYFLPQGELSNPGLFDIIQISAITIQMFNGIIFWLCDFTVKGFNGVVAFDEIGGTYLLVAGILNILTIFDNYDICINKKQ